jgi:hypothetical protein
MGSSTGLLVQSKYFLPVFNMAIFDGPFRLYFAQDQEAEALRLYFELHEILGERVQAAGVLSANEKALFVLMYPDEKVFAESFGTNGAVADTWVGDSAVVAVRGPVWEDSALQHVISRIEEIFDTTPPPSRLSAAEI